MSKQRNPDKYLQHGTRRLQKKIIFSIWLILIYRLGQFIPLPWTGGLRYYEAMQEGIIGFIQSTLGTNVQDASLFSLGLIPYMTASILVQMFHLSGPRRRKTSVRELQRKTRYATLLLSLVYGTVKVRGLGLLGNALFTAHQVELITVIGLAAGGMLVMWLGECNIQNGIGGMSLLIAVNIVSGIAQNVIRGEYAPPGREGWIALGAMLFYCVLTILLVVFMENSQLRIPVYRAMIDSPVQGESYLAVRMNPAGTLPVMYVMAFFTLPLYILGFLRIFFPHNKILAFWVDNLNLNNLVGVGTFLFLFYLMTRALSSLYINPEDIEEDLRRSGDYIEGVRPGRATRKYVRKRIRRLARFSALVMGLCIGAPMVYACFAKETGKIYFLPMTVAILSGIVMNILEETSVLRIFDAYRPRL